MKPFRLPLQVLRTLREQEEQAAQIAYADAIRRREAARERVLIALQQLEDAWNGLRLGPAKGVPADELQRNRQWCDVLVEHRRELEQALQLAQGVVEKTLRELHHARRALETITRYQRRKQETHAREAHRLEQKEMDEVGTRLATLNALVSV